MAKKLAWVAILFLASTALFAGNQICPTKAPPGAPAGWTHAGRACKTEGQNCGGLCLCATRQHINFATKTVTFSCPCLAPKVDVVDLEGLPSLGERLLQVTISPYAMEGFVAAVLGSDFPDGLQPADLAGLTAHVSLELEDGSVVEASSEPLRGEGLDFGIQIPWLSREQVVQYTLTLGEYVQQGQLE